MATGHGRGHSPVPIITVILMLLSARQDHRLRLPGGQGGSFVLVGSIVLVLTNPGKMSKE